MNAAAPAWFPAVDRRAVATFAVLVVVLLGPWPGVGRGFSRAFCVYGNGVVRALGVGAPAAPRFAPPSADARRGSEFGEWTVMLSADGDAWTPLDTRILAYTPLALFVALVAATRVARRRKVIILAAGLAFLLARLAVAVALPVARAFGPARSGWAFGTVAELTWWVLVTPPALAYATPLLTWWVALAATTPAATTPAAPAPVSGRRRRARASRR